MCIQKPHLLSSSCYGAAVLSSNSPFIFALASVFTVNNSLVFTTLWRSCSVFTTLWRGCSVFTTLWRGCSVFTTLWRGCFVFTTLWHSCSVFRVTLHLHKWISGWTAEDGQFWWRWDGSCYGKLLWRWGRAAEDGQLW